MVSDYFLVLSCVFPMRLDKYCAKLGWFTRRNAKKLTKHDPIFVNGTARSIDSKVVAGDLIEWSGRKVTVLFYIYAILHKKAGYVSSDFAEYDYPSYRKLLNDCPYSKLVHVAGRLDQDTEGLLLLSSDGKFIHNIISPKKKVPKTYHVELQKNIDDAAIVQLEEGVILDDGSKTLPASCKRISSNIIELTIVEGKFHQVKRMLEAVDNKVVYLKRLSVGSLNLELLGLGERRYLSEQEISDFL